MLFYTDADYSDMPIPSSLSLNITNSRGCVSIGITNDNIVEGTEMFLVHFIETDDNQITIAGSSTASVFIQDDESRFFHLLSSFIFMEELIFFLCAVTVLEFGQMTYMFSESNSNMALVDIEIANFDQLDIQNNVSVAVSVNATATNANEDGMCSVIHRCLL